MRNERRIFLEKIIFSPDGEEPVEFYCLEQTVIGAKTYLLVTDEEDGDLTDKIEIINNTIKEDVLGTYEVTYQVTDKNNKTVTKTIKVTVAEIVYEKKEPLAHLALCRNCRCWILFPRSRRWIR